MNPQSLQAYKYNGARSRVLLHEQYMNSLLKTWCEAKRLNISLPKTLDKDYRSLESLLHHIFRAARGYMVWMCEKLELPDPEIKSAPEVEINEKEADVYLNYLLEKWRTPLADVPEDRFHSLTYSSRWNVDYCIDAMLEHAVMHPIRHEFQLKFLITKHLTK